MIYTASFEAFLIGAVADSFSTAIAMLIPDTTAGHRARIRELTIGPAVTATYDNYIAVKIARIEDVSGGTAGTADATIAAADMNRMDPDGPIPFWTCPIEYSVEPTAYDAKEVWGTGLHGYSTIDKHWTAEMAPVALRDQLLGVLLAPRAAADGAFSGTITMEDF